MAATFDLATTELQEDTVLTELDPRLQVLVAKRRAGMMKEATSATDADEVAVVARVDNVSAWMALGEVREPLEIGYNPSGEGIVTGRIPLHRVEKVREQSFVLSLKAGRQVQPSLAQTTEDTGARPNLLPAGHQASGGKGVIVGVIDYGADFVHQNFRLDSGSTRLTLLWDQNGGNSPSSPFGYGREHTANQVNSALQQSDPYASLNYHPGTNAHGTHVMDIAAGNGRGTSVAGMAPEAELIFVNVTHDKDPSDTNVVGKSFGDSVTMLEAVKYIFNKAGAKPCVINVSLGTNGGPHDGSTLVEQGIDSMLSAQPNRCLVMSAANSFDDGIHSSGQVAQGATHDLLWDVSGTLFFDIEMEIWYPNADRLTVDLIAPNGAVLASVPPNTNKQVTSGGRIIAFVANRLNDPNNHDNMIGIFLQQGMPGGAYTIRLRGDTVVTGGFHAWIERDNNFQSQFRPPHDSTHTIGSISCAQKLIAVGSYDAHVPGAPLSFFSSAGPTRDGRQKPEVSAPGHNVWAAKSLSKTGVTRMSGTSMASPAVAGLVALVFAEAKARGVSLTIDQTRKIVQDCARRSPPAGTAWHDRYGNGRVSAAAAVQAVMNLPPVPGGGAPKKKVVKKAPKKVPKKSPKKAPKKGT